MHPALQQLAVLLAALTILVGFPAGVIAAALLWARDQRAAAAGTLGVIVACAAGLLALAT